MIRPRGDGKGGLLTALRERVLDFRDGLMSAPAFQRWAARFPLTRPVARSRARALFDLCAGFVYSQVLFACVRLRLIETLAEGPKTLGELCRATGLPEEGTLRLLHAAASLDLVMERAGGRYGLGKLGVAMAGNPGIAAMVEHHAVLYTDLADPVGLLSGQANETALGRYWPYARTEDPDRLGAQDVADYSALMAASQHFIAGEVLDAYPIQRHAKILDVGGGEGRFLAEVARHAPGLELTLFDLPAVAARADGRFAEAGLAGRARAVGGNFFSDPLPKGADVVSLVRILHDHDDGPALAILRAAREALPPGGTILIAEPMADTPGAEPIGDAYFGFYLMAMGSGRPRRPQEIRDLLAEAGFVKSRLVPTHTPMLTRLMTARKPS